MLIKNAYYHLRKIQLHRKWVRRYCFKVGLIWQGLTHDLSKYSPVEFVESVKYYVGSSSPIDECKKKNGVSYAWLHHRGRNAHHWEYWMDNFEKGGEPLLMPYKYAAELLCDYLGAGKAYMDEDFSWAKEWDWWVKQRTLKKMHPAITYFLDLCLMDLLTMGDVSLNEKRVKENYAAAVKRGYADKELRFNLTFHCCDGNYGSYCGTTEEIRRKLAEYQWVGDRATETYIKNIKSVLTHGYFFEFGDTYHPVDYTIDNGLSLVITYLRGEKHV